MANNSRRYRRRRRSVLPRVLLFAAILAALCVFVLFWSTRGEKTPDSLFSADSEQQEEAENTSFVIVLDPGHGGNDAGALSAEEDVMEKDVNLAVALYACQLLERYSLKDFGLGAEWEDVVILMTREDDSYVSLSERVELAEDAGAELFVSVHANALENSTTWTGIYTYYHPDKPEDAALAQTVQQALIAATGAVDRGADSGDYYVLRETSMPAILIETGFLSSPAELALLTDSTYQQALAQGIADGVLAYTAALE